MDLLGWATINKEALKILYGLIITIICLIIVLRTHKLYRISLHQGIRYFRNAFFFYGIGFFAKYVLESLAFIFQMDVIFIQIISILFKFFLVMAGFFLLYSLLWKKIEASREDYPSSLFHPKISIFYFMTIIVVILDHVWLTHFFTFISQIIVFTLASVISLVNYQKNPQRQFLKFYFIAMVLSLIAWLLNAFIALYFQLNSVISISIFLINTFIFLLFLYGVVKFTNK